MQTANRWDFFFHTESNRRRPQDQDAFHVSMPFPTGTSLKYALRWMWDNKLLAKGSHRAGCFEVQTPDGIYRQVDGNRIDLSTDLKAAKVQFKTWEQLDDDENASSLELPSDEGVRIGG